MPTGTCLGCRRTTNSTTSNWWQNKDRTPTKCLVAWEESGEAVRGCAYDEASDQVKAYADDVIRISNQRLAAGPALPAPIP